MDNQPGMRIKSHHYRFPATSVGFFLHDLKNVLMAQVYPIESTHADYRVGSRLKEIDIVINFQISQLFFLNEVLRYLNGIGSSPFS